MYAVYLYRQDRQPEAPMRLIELRGFTMGTTYQIKYIGNKVLQKEIDSVLRDFNQSLSTYIPGSEISVFNETEQFKFVSPYFPQVLKISKKIHDLTAGAFDPTVMPLVKAWGFGPNKTEYEKEPNIDSLLQFVGMDKLAFDEKEVRKKLKGVQLDFNAVAQGQASDVIAKFLEGFGFENYMVEIGGEIICRGKNANNETWTIGIENPLYETEGGQRVFAVASLDNAALVTSGNYRKFYVKDGKKFAHTLDPKTGRPVSHNLLSATVVTASCADADALATAFMVMGKERAIAFAEKHSDIHIFLIYEENGKLTSFASEGMKKFLKITPEAQ
jgi:thiamine biosynthesis lipoprotein